MNRDGAQIPALSFWIMSPSNTEPPTPTLGQTLRDWARPLHISHHGSYIECSKWVPYRGLSRLSPLQSVCPRPTHSSVGNRGSRVLAG